jgi:invasion protein IalB
VIRFLTALSALAVAIVIMAAPAHAQKTAPKDVLKEKIGDWEIRCIEGTNTCAMSQVGTTDDGKRAILVTLQRITGAKTKDGKDIPAAMTVQTPLGILIPYGLRIKIDGDKVIPLPLARCIPAGCVSQAPMLDEAVDKMKKGTKAVFGYFLQQEILVNVSLSGFTKAFDSLTPVQAKGN